MRREAPEIALSEEMSPPDDLQPDHRWAKVSDCRRWSAMVAELETSEREAQGQAEQAIANWNAQHGRIAELLATLVQVRREAARGESLRSAVLSGGLDASDWLSLAETLRNKRGRCDLLYSEVAGAIAAALQAEEASDGDQPPS